MRKVKAIGLCLFLVIASPISLAQGGEGPNAEIVQMYSSIKTIFSSGDGSLGNPYIITNAWELQNMSTNLTAHYALGNDIDASITAGWNLGTGFVCIGYNSGTRFIGSLDGRNHTIAGLYINRSGSSDQGLFGWVDTGGLVKNVGLVDNDVSGAATIGGLVAYLIHGTVSNCYATGSVHGNDYSVGGLVGYNNHGTVSNCYTTGNVSGSSSVGGLVGYIHTGTVSNCYASGNIVAKYGANIGGLVGNNIYGTVSKSYATGSLTRLSGTAESIGGFVGQNNQGKVLDCYSTGGVFYDNAADPTNKGFAGYVYTGGGYEMTGNFWDIETSGQTSTYGIAIGKTTTEMKTRNTFTSVSWNFDSVWWMIDGQTRPFLIMEWSDKIYNTHQLQMIIMNLTADYTIASDIHISEITKPSQMWGTTLTTGTGFVPIGTDANNFIGSLDGCNHTIVGMHINRPNTDYQGVFGHVGVGSVVKNICLVNSYVSGMDIVAGLVGENKGTVSHCYAIGNVRGGDSVAGGLVGNNNQGIVTKSYSTVNVRGNFTVGGLVGNNNQGMITMSYATGIVNGSFTVGGLVGLNEGGMVANSYATGCVTRSSGTDTNFGGFVGKNAQGKVINCYSTGRVIYDGATNPMDKGFAGCVETGGIFEMTADFWDMETSLQNGSTSYATGETTLVMKTQSTFTNVSWDFDNIWWMRESVTYPLLQWRPLQPESVSPSGDLMFIQVQDSELLGYKNLSTEQFETSIQEISTSGIPTGGGTYKLGDAWITEVFPEARDISGTWTFNISGKISGTTGDGTLRAEVYSLTNGWLFSAPSSDSVAGHDMYYDFTWTYDVLYGITIPANDRIYVEFWLDATSGGTDSGQTVNPGFDMFYFNNWTYHDWVDGISGDEIHGIWSQYGGNPDGAIGVDISRGMFTWVGTLAGYWEQPFTATSIPGSALLEFDWRCSNYQLGFGPLTFYVFIDSLPGNPNPNKAIWSQTVVNPSSWASVGPIDVSNVVDSASAYYLKIAFSAFTVEWDNCEGLFDNVQVSWTTPPAPEFTLGYDNDSTPSSLYIHAEIDANPPRHSNESPAIDGLSETGTPTISVDVTDIFGINTGSIKYYINGYRVFHDFTSIPDGYKVSYWHESGFSPDEIVTCRIVVEDTNGNLLDFTWQFMVLHSFEIVLHEGWNLISIPFLETNWSLEAVFSPIAGMYDSVQTYDSAMDTWSLYDANAPFWVNSLSELDERYGYWIHVTAGNDIQLPLFGQLRQAPATIQLHKGWNLLGYPTTIQTMTVSQVFSGVPWDILQKGNVSYTYNLESIPETYMIKPGEGYWIHVAEDCLWTVE